MEVQICSNLNLTIHRMKRNNSWDISGEHTMKKSKHTDSTLTKQTEPILNTFISVDVIKHKIIPFGALDWLLIAKEYHQYAIKHIVDDTRVLERSDEILAKAAELRNFPLIERLLQDERYTSTYTLKGAINTVINEDDKALIEEDKTVITLLLSHRLFATIQPDNILYKAIVKGWIDIVQHILSISEHTFEGWSRNTAIYKRAPVEMIKFLRQDPRFYSETSFARALESAIFAGKTDVVHLMLQEDRTDFNTAVKVLSRFSSGIQILLTDSRLLESPDYHLTLWNELASYNCEDGLGLILKDGQIDPNLYDDNYVLYIMSKWSFPTMVELLLQDDRVKPTKKPSKRNPVVVAVKYRRKDMIDILIMQPKIDKGWLDHALIYCTKKGYLKSVKFALQNYNEIISNKAKHKALHSAEKRGYQNIINLLCEYK